MWILDLPFNSSMTYRQIMSQVWAQALPIQTKNSENQTGWLVAFHKDWAVSAQQGFNVHCSPSSLFFPKQKLEDNKGRKQQQKLHFLHFYSSIFVFFLLFSFWDRASSRSLNFLNAGITSMYHQTKIFFLMPISSDYLAIKSKEKWKKNKDINQEKHKPEQGR